MNQWELFIDLFAETDHTELRSMYEAFAGCITKAVERANSMISLTTLPGFTPAYLHEFRGKVIAGLNEEVAQLSAFYINNPKFKCTEEDSRQLIDKYKLAKQFLQKNMQYALVGTSQYAKSFLTSEYLYRYFKDNPMFDYTPIVSGYIKSIEQLLYVICRSYLYTVNRDEYMGNWTMGNYKYFINDNENLLRPELREAKDIIVNCLESYRIESRNHLFHRDYFNDWERVEVIRKNTFFLYVTFLGMIDEKLIAGNSKLLGILDEQYDRLFTIIDKDQSNYYTLELKGKEYSKMEKVPRSEGIIYAWNGLIRNTLCFHKFNYDHFERVEISPKNIPATVWSTDSMGNKIKLLWEM